MTNHNQKQKITNMNEDNTTTNDRRSFLKTVGVGAASITVASTGTLAQATGSTESTSGKSVKLVQMNLVNEITASDDGLTPAEIHGDRFTQYAIQNDALIVLSEEAEQRLSFDELIVSPQNLGAESFQSASDPVSLTGGSEYLTTELSKGLSPTKVVQVKTAEQFGKATITETGDGAVEVEYRGEKTTLGPKSSGQFTTSQKKLQIEMIDSSGETTFAPATVTPVLHVEYHGELDYHSGVKRP
jgi:hypothetical protein